MEEFYRFYVEKTEFDNKTLIAKFYYSFDKKTQFVEKVDFSSNFLSCREDFDNNIFSNFLFPLSIALGISYYKAYPTKEIIIENGYLNCEDIEFWQKFYRNGLGEFLFKNNILPEGLFNFVNISNVKIKKIDFETNDRILLPIGGGKDSIVSAEILRKMSLDFTPIIFGKTDLIKENCIKVLGIKNILIKRDIDQNLFKLNEQGYYNGHVPITGIISFILLSSAYLYDFKYIVLSNEKSANNGNTKIGKYGEKGYLEINHQYSKSQEFERDLNIFINRNLSLNLKYFSLLSGLYEIKIAEIFSRVGKNYFKVFSSCNNNFKILKDINLKSQKIWCNSCPKCVFVYTILRPFITDAETIDIFGKELFEEKNLENLFKELLGLQGIKPFECVGEEKEVIFAMKLSYDLFLTSKKEMPYILKMFECEFLNVSDNNYFKDLEEKHFRNYYEESHVPQTFRLDI